MSWPSPLEMIALVEEYKKQRAKERRDNIISIATVIISLSAAVAAIGATLEAHWTRVIDDRPFIAIDAAPDIPQAFNFHSGVNLTAGETIPLKTVVTAFGKSPSEHIHIFLCDDGRQSQCQVEP